MPYTWTAPAILITQPDFTGESLNHAHATQAYTYPMAAGLGIVTVWSGDQDDLTAQFYVISLSGGSQAPAPHISTVTAP